MNTSQFITNSLQAPTPYCVFREWTLTSSVISLGMTRNMLCPKPFPIRPNRPVTIEVEPEEEVDADEKGPYILQSEVEKAIMEMRNKKATGDDDVPGDVLKLFGEGGLKITTKLINTIYETGEWSKDFTEVTMIV